MNNTLDHNHELGQPGMVALWVGVVSHSFSAFAYIIASKRGKESHQLYYNINTIICSVASMCYFLMALRQTDYITQEGKLVLWSRYMEFLIGTPLLLIDLCMLIGIPNYTIFYVCFMDILMIGAGWFATISTTTMSKWLLFILGCFFFYPILDTVLGITPDPKNVRSDHNRFVVLYTAVVWNGYVLLWILHDGFGWVSLDTECIMHTVLDILAKDLFGVVLLYEKEKQPEIVVTEVQTVTPSVKIRRASTGPPIVSYSENLHSPRTRSRSPDSGHLRSPSPADSRHLRSPSPECDSRDIELEQTPKRNTLAPPSPSSLTFERIRQMI